MTTPLPDPPPAFARFAARFPRAAQAWSLLSEEGENGPLDRREQRLVKLAVAIGTGRTGPVHAAVRKAEAAGIDAEDMAQVVALAAATIGLPAAVAAFQWIEESRKEPGEA